MPYRNRTVRYITLPEMESLNLPLREGDVREDGFSFKQYYIRINNDTGEESKIYEQWYSQETLRKQKILIILWVVQKLRNHKFFCMVK